jgi:hypothetical protein
MDETGTTLCEQEPLQVSYCVRDSGAELASSTTRRLPDDPGPRGQRGHGRRQRTQRIAGSGHNRLADLLLQQRRSRPGVELCDHLAGRDEQSPIGRRWCWSPLPDHQRTCRELDRQTDSRQVLGSSAGQAHLSAHMSGAQSADLQRCLLGRISSSCGRRLGLGVVNLVLLPPPSPLAGLLGLRRPCARWAPPARQHVPRYPSDRHLEILE